MVIVFDKKLGVKLIYFQIVYNIVLGFLTSVLGLPHFMNYVTDIITILLLVIIRKKIIHAFIKSRFRSVLYTIGIFWGVASLSTLINLVPFLLYVWALRNVFRFYVFFLACGTLLDEEDVDHIFDIMYKLQYLNIALCLYEYFIWGCKQDTLGGLFGIDVGCNGSLNLYLIIILTWAFSKYMAKKLNLIRLLVVLISAMGMGALSELKILFLEIVIIAVMIFFLFKPSFKHVFFVVAGVCALFVGLTMLQKVFKGAFRVLTEKQAFWEYANSNYVGGKSLSRVMALQQINKNYFHNKLFRILFGYGFGACEMSSFFQSDFYSQYGEITWYRWFGHAMLFLETGLIGLLSYILFFIDVARNALMRMKQLAGYKYHAVIVIVMSALAIAITCYNATLRIECAYMIFFVLAIVAADVRSMQEKEMGKKV